MGGETARCYKFSNYSNVLGTAPDRHSCAAAADVSVHITSNINTRHSPKHVAAEYPPPPADKKRQKSASLQHFFPGKSSKRAGTWIIRHHLLLNVADIFSLLASVSLYVCRCLCMTLCVCASACLYFTLIAASPGNSPNSLCSTEPERSRWWERRGLRGCDIS